MMALHAFAAPAARDDAFRAHRTYLETRRFGSLDGLRFLCIAAVLWHHAPFWMGWSEPAPIVTRGFLGVNFFFVLSGYLITTLLLRERRSSGRFSLSRFYWRRILRIMPPYVLVVTAVAAYYIVLKGETRYIELLPYYYLFLSNFLTEHLPTLGPTWSLSVEEQYYLVWPLLLLVCPSRALLPVLACLVAVNLAASTGALSLVGIEAFDFGPLRFAMFTATYAPILIGSALAIALDRARMFVWLYALLGHASAAPVAFAVLAAMLYWLPGDIDSWAGLLVHTVMAACLATIVIREDHAMAPLLSVRPIARIGEISYGIYLYHLVALHIATAGLAAVGMQGSAVLLPAYVLISIAMAEASFRTYERWFLSLKDRNPGPLAARMRRSGRRDKGRPDLSHPQ